MPEEFVLSICQDEQGYIWCSTQLGAFRFDGYEIESFGGDFQNDNGLQLQYTIGGIIKGKDGKLWIGGFFNGGIASYTPFTREFTNYLYDPDNDNSILYPDCQVLLEDSHGDIWAGNQSMEPDKGVLLRLDQSSQQIFNYPYLAVFGLRNEVILNYSIAESRLDSAIWIIDRGEFGANTLRRFDRESNEFESIIPPGGTIPGSSTMDTLIDIVPMGKSDLFVLSSPTHVYLWDPIKRTCVEEFQHSIQPQSSWCAFEDKKGLIWILLSGSTICYDREKDEWIIVENVNYPLVGLSELDKSQSLLYPVYQTSTDLWFDVLGSDRNAFLRYNYNTALFYGYDDSFNFDKNGRINSVLSRFYEDEFGIKWFGTRPNLYKEDPKMVSMELFEKSDDIGSLPSDTITQLLEDSRGNLWIGTNNGLCLYDDKSKQFRTYRKNLGVTSLTDNEIVFMFEDNVDQLWIGTTNGLSLFDQNRRKVKKLFTNQGNVASISQDHTGNIWVSILEEGVYTLNIKGEILQSFNSNSEAKHLLKSNMITTIFHDGKGRTWLGDPTINYGVFRYEEKKGKFKHYGFVRNDDSEIKWISEDERNNVWIGSDLSLKMYDPALDSFINFANLIDGFGSMTSYASGENGKFWVGTYGGAGLVNISSESGQYYTKGENDGMLHSQVMIRGQIPMDQMGNLYLPNNRGLSVYNTDTETFKNFGEAYGFQEPDRIYCGITRKNGEVWIGGRHGLNKILPQELLIKKNTIPPKVWITSMTIMDSTYAAPDGEIFTKSVDFTDEIELEYWQKNLDFDFVALHYLSPEDNQYSWKLEGYDDNWTTASKTRRATYTNLSPGVYTFRVKGSNADGIWNEEGDYITITIAPPFWLTTWAYGIYLIILGLVGFGIYRVQKARIIKREQDRIKDQQLAQAIEIEQAYTDLKHTQTQLIHSEKMASLGELTAGIAHEIQNPLNFVNNFSDLNKELLEELKDAVAQNDQEEVTALIKDLSENETKIIHHGKRAEEIVKSMLQHSRTGSVEKELTDINALADEYLRLAYHGLRAKDKSFNADFKAELEPDMPKVKVIAQDIGRVILNLINNAFQAVQGAEKPEVLVSTKLRDNQIEITVADNGSGIPDDIKEKIFQPFFTTKPTGEGTGLGLSMSYDIVTKGHGGTIEMESEEGRGTKFIITIPIDNRTH